MRFWEKSFLLDLKKNRYIFNSFGLASWHPVYEQQCFPAFMTQWKRWTVREEVICHIIIMDKVNVVACLVTYSKYRVSRHDRGVMITRCSLWKLINHCFCQDTSTWSQTLLRSRLFQRNISSDQLGI